MITSGTIGLVRADQTGSLIDFYFWEDLKDKIYKYSANDVEELGEHFENCIQRVSNIHIYNAIRSLSIMYQTADNSSTCYDCYVIFFFFSCYFCLVYG